MARVTLEGIAKRFGDTVALDQVDLTVDDGEFVVLFGAPGAGKSTVLKLIAGIEEPTAGRVTIAGADMNGVAPQRRDIALAFESYALYPHMNVRRNLEFPLVAPGRDIAASVREASINQVAQLLEITQLLARSPRQLSGGQRQRVSLGRALVRRANITLLDEPIAHLDARLRNALRAELRVYQRERGATTLYATPDYLEAFGVADRIVVLIGGRVAQAGTPRAIFDAPATTGVAALIGDPRMNLVPVTDASIPTRTGPVPVGHLGVDADKVRHVGLRPDDIDIIAVDGSSLRGEVRVSEPLGADELVRVDLGGHSLTLRRPLATHARIGETVSLAPHWDRALAYDAGGRLLVRGVG